MLSLLAVAACGGGSVSAQAGHSPQVALGPVESVQLVPHAVAGEGMSYDIEFRGVSVGRLRIAVGPVGKIDGRPVIVIRSEVDSTGLVAAVRDVSWQLDSTLDGITGMPVSTESVWSSNVQGLAESGREHQERPEHHDMNSLISVVRGWEPAPGARISVKADIGGRFSVVFGPATREYNRRFQVAALRIEGAVDIGERRRFTLWTSDDARRVPLRFEMQTAWGRAAVSLLRYDGPGRDFRARGLSPI